MRYFTRAAFAASVIGAGVVLIRRRRSPRPIYPEATTLILSPQVETLVQRDTDGNFVLSWTHPAKLAGIRAGTSPESFPYQLKLPDTAYEPPCIIKPPPRPAARWYFELTFDDGSVLKSAERIVPMEALFNVRDLGGYKTEDGKHVRWGQVYRSGTLGSPSAADIERMAGLGIRLICDLRSIKETDIDPDHRFDNTLYHHLPMNADQNMGRQLRTMLLNRRKIGTMLQEIYTRNILAHNAPAIAQTLRMLAQPENHPMLMHCTAGKDRTGIAAAILLRVLGVPEDTVIADYTLTNHYFQQIFTITRDNLHRLSTFGLKLDDVQPLLVANAETLRFTLNYLKAYYGSVEGYLEQVAGLESSVLDALKAALLE